MALRENFLNKKQLGTILKYQRMNGGLFGEIAVALEYIRQNDIKKLLILQKKKRSLSRDILVLNGAISRDDMEEELKIFHETEATKEHNMMNDISI